MSVGIRKSHRDHNSLDFPNKEDFTNSEADPASDSSSDEDEDEDGDLITTNIDEGIDNVLTALKSGSEKLKDKAYRFFPEIGAEGTAESLAPTKKEKPVYLKDYQREQLLGQGKADTRTYVEEQKDLKEDLIKGFHEADNSDENASDEELLTKREEPRELPDVELPNPDTNADEFLSAFVSNRGWVPKGTDRKPTYKEVVDEDSDEFDDLSEKFESAYNFRYEDPDAAEIVSYARDQNSLRRGKLSSRQKKREKEKEAKEKELAQQKLEMAKMKKTKVNEVTSKLAQLQEALGEGDERVAELLSKEDLDGDWDNDEWDKRMQRLFDEEYYGRDAGKSKGQSEDLGEDVGEGTGKLADEGNPSGGDGDIREGARLSRKQLKRKAEEFVESNQDLLDEAMIPESGPKFRYNEVDPESFGLTSRDILLASDKELNQYAGIKKLASYRNRTAMENDRKKLSKSKRLRKWRQEVFGKETAPDDEAWEKAKVESVEHPVKKHKKHKKNNK